MSETTSHGILIRVKPSFHGNHNTQNQPLSAFSYTVVIENTSEHSYQLLSRYWQIIDPLYPVKIIEGEGVLGQTPILLPHSIFTYQSNVVSKSGIGAMKGFYILKNISNNTLIHVRIPCFQLTSEFRKN